jgi:hypothetical protein
MRSNYIKRTRYIQLFKSKFIASGLSFLGLTMGLVIPLNAQPLTRPDLNSQGVPLGISADIYYGGIPTNGQSQVYRESEIEATITELHSNRKSYGVILVVDQLNPSGTPSAQRLSKLLNRVDINDYVDQVVGQRVRVTRFRGDFLGNPPPGAPPGPPVVGGPTWASPNTPYVARTMVFQLADGPNPGPGWTDYLSILRRLEVPVPPGQVPNGLWAKRVGATELDFTVVEVPFFASRNVSASVRINTVATPFSSRDLPALLQEADAATGRYVNLIRGDLASFGNQVAPGTAWNPVVANNSRFAKTVSVSGSLARNSVDTFAGRFRNGTTVPIRIPSNRGNITVNLSFTTSIAP